MRLTTRQRHSVFGAAVLLTILSAVLYCSWPLGFVLNPAASRAGLASELGAFGQPYNWVFIGGDIVSGALLVAGVGLLFYLYRPTGWARLALVLLALYGICGAIDAALPMSCLPSEQTCGPVLGDPLLILHGAADFVQSIALIGTFVAAAVYVYGRSRRWTAWVWTIGAGAVVFAALSAVVVIWGGPGNWNQRYYITLSCIWVMSVPFVLRPKRAMLVGLNTRNIQRQREN